MKGTSGLTGGVTVSGGAREERSLTLHEVEAAIRSSWSVETCDPTDEERWTPENPSLGQCAVTALVVHDLLGGELLEAEVHYTDGTRQGFHYWNRLAGVDIDLTRAQFAGNEHVQSPHLVDGCRRSHGWRRTSTSSFVTASGRICSFPGRGS